MEDVAAEFGENLSDRFDVVCFDLDQCAVQCHSRGKLLRQNLDDFASHISPDFVRAVPALLKCNVKLAIVTHSDLAEHGPSKSRRGPDACVLGDELVHEVLLRVVPEHAHEFFVVAWRPRSRGTEGAKDPGKLRHMRACAAFYGVPLERCVLFDDDATNCTLTNGMGGTFSAYKCNPEIGFRFTDYNKESGSDYFIKRSDGTIDRLDRWNRKWNHDYKGKPRFHLPIANPNLVKFYGKEFDPPKDRPILLPLCGKTIDLQWLMAAGHQCVVGVEGIQQCIEELRDEIPYNLRSISESRNQIWTTAPEGREWISIDASSNSNSNSTSTSIQEPKEDAWLSVVCTDFFEISPVTFGAQDSCFAAIYDRGAIVAVPPYSRHQYVDVMDSLLAPGGQIFMVTVDSGSDGGPPFPITPGVIEELFATRDYSIQLLDKHDGDFSEASKEYVFVLTKSM